MSAKHSSHKRVLLTRPPERTAVLTRSLEESGILATSVATTEIETVVGAERQRLEAALLAVADYQWVLFTSVNAVRACASLMGSANRPMSSLAGNSIAAVGEATRSALAEFGLSPSLVGNSTGEALCTELANRAKSGDRILYPRSEQGRVQPVEILRAASLDVDTISAYRSRIVSTETPELSAVFESMRSGSFDAIVFFAPSQVKALEHLMEDFEPCLAAISTIAAIGPTTAAALTARGIHVDIVPESPTSGELFDSILQAFS